MITKLKGSFSSFEEDLIYLSECSITDFCRTKGITMMQYFAYLKDHPELQEIHNKAREIQEEVHDYILHIKFKDVVTDNNFTNYRIIESEHGAIRIEEGADVRKAKFLSELIAKNKITELGTNIEININSNDL